MFTYSYSYICIHIVGCKPNAGVSSGQGEREGPPHGASYPTR